MEEKYCENCQCKSCNLSFVHHRGDKSGYKCNETFLSCAGCTNCSNFTSECKNYTQKPKKKVIKTKSAKK